MERRKEEDEKGVECERRGTSSRGGGGRGGRGVGRPAAMIAGTRATLLLVATVGFLSALASSCGGGGGGRGEGRGGSSYDQRRVDVTISVSQSIPHLG